MEFGIWDLEFLNEVKGGGEKVSTGIFDLKGACRGRQKTRKTFGTNLIANEQLAFAPA